MAGKKLLVADDSLTIQKVIRLALSNEGYEIQAVSDGNEATQQIAVFRPDVVLIDVSLPGKSAFEVKKALNETPDAGDVRFVLMSSAFEKVDESGIAELKFHGRLTKPFDPAHLRQVLNDVLAQPGGKKLSAAAPATDPSKISLAPPEEDDFSKPIQPSETEPAPSGLEEGESIVQELWDQDSKSLEESAARTEISITHHDESEFQVSPPARPAGKGNGEDSDIRELTESTIRMSGLDDFQWSVNETAKKAAPAAAEDIPAMNGFELSPPAETQSQPQYVGENTLTQLQRREPTLDPPAGMADLGDATFKLDPPHASVPELPPFDPDSAAASGTPSSAAQTEPASGAQAFDMGTGGAAAEAHAIPLSNDQLEQLLSRQIHKSLEETLAKMTQKILPEIAERVIKQEIHKLLSEQL